MSNFDLIVIGGGPGGYVAAIKGAQLGLNTAIIEKDRFGGTCLNRGCIPTKAMLHAADLYREILEGGRFGIHAEKVTVNYGEVLDYKQETIDKLVSGVEQLLKANGVTMLKGTGTLLADRQVKVTFAEPAEDGATESYYDAEHIILAGGSYPAKLPVEGMELEGVLTSDGLFALKEIPESLTIIGGGVIGVEFAEVFSALGCKVTILEALPKLLANLDKEISQNLKMILKKRGVDIHTGASLAKIEKDPAGGLICHYTEKDKDQAISSQYVLCAVGRKPNAAGVRSWIRRNLLISRKTLRHLRPNTWKLRHRLLMTWVSPWSEASLKPTSTDRPALPASMPSAISSKASSWLTWQVHRGSRQRKRSRDIPRTWILLSFRPASTPARRSLPSASPRKTPKLLQHR